MSSRLPVILVATFCVAMAFILLYALVQIATPAPPPLAYDQAVYVPETVALCPGESLVYTNTLTISQSGAIYGAPTWFSGRGTTAVPILGFAFADLVGRTFDQVPVIITRRRENKVPPMPPGPAEMRWVATNFKGRDAVHRVEFVIRNDCVQ